MSKRSLVSYTIRVHREVESLNEETARDEAWDNVPYPETGDGEECECARVYVEEI